jgi:hypothetical protein
VGALLVALGPAMPAAADVLHVYDGLNRLRATVDPGANSAAIWTYDAVGNILSITRQTATQTTILELPAEAIAEACGVRILGIGFSTTPGQNTVTVNGVAATVQTATATELVVCLGGGTTTGPVVVTTPTGSDTSDGSLPVQAALAIPTITGFTPTVADWGTSLSLTGTHFDPDAGQTRVRMGATSLLAPVSGVTATSLNATVPPGTTSGRLTLTTPMGTAVAPSDLFVAPAPYTAVDVAATGRLALTGSQTVTVPAFKQALFVFDGTVAQKVCVGTTLVSGPSLETAVYQPAGTIWVTPAFYGGSAVEMAPLPGAGTYSIRVRSGSSTTSVETVTLYDASDQGQGTIPTDGTATPLSFATPCYRAGRTFTGTVGQRVSLLTSSTVNGSSVLTLANPDGTTLTTSSVGNGSTAFLEPVTLTQTGPHTLWGDPSGSSTGTLTLRLYDVPADVATPITPNGTPVTATLPVPGQRAALPFSGTAGQRASVYLDQLGFDGSAWIRQPDQSVLGPVQAFSTGQTRYVEIPVFPATGTYHVLVDPTGAGTGAARVSLWTYTDVTGTLTLGVATPVTFTAPGQRALLTFAGTAGQRVTLQTSNPSGPIGATIAASVLKPDGTVLVSVSLGIPGLLGAMTLPVDGTYTVLLDPPDMATGTLDVTVATSTGAGITLAWNGKIRDRVNPSEGLGPDGALDGTLTATVTGGAPTVTQLVLEATGAGSGRWDTIPSNSYWLLGAAMGLDDPLLNAGNGTVSFAVADGGSFVMFATDWFNGKFVPGTTLTVTATFSGGTTAVAGVTVP